MLLIIEALLLILAALGQDHSAAAAPARLISLDMAVNSVDDQYYGCEGEMADLVNTTYLKYEMSVLPEFNEAWQEGEEKAKKAEDNLQQIHSVAIHVYTNKDSNVYSNFNSATRTGKEKYQSGTFEWYSLHFLLTKAIQILKKTQNECYVTYRGTNVEFDVQSKEVRLSSFSSSSLDREVARGFGNKYCFEIYTCEGANLTKYSKYPDEKEVLIPPYETFKVTAVKNSSHQHLWCETVFVLNSTGKKSEPNCALFSSGNHAAFCNILLILQILFCKVFSG